MATLKPFSVLITGANRGIGLGLVKQFLNLPAKPAHVFAACRQPAAATELNSLAGSHGNLHVVELDAVNYEQQAKAFTLVQNTVGERGLTILINNAGIGDRSGLGDISRQAMMNVFEVNCVAPLMLTKTFRPLLQKAASASAAAESALSPNKALVVNITSIMSSIAENRVGGYYAYRAAKAALNMVSVSLRTDLRGEGILVGLLHPGWVKTDMGGPEAPTSLLDSVSGIMTTLAGLKPEQSGQFLTFSGGVLPW